MMTNGDPEGRIFLFYPHTKNGFFFLLSIFFSFQNKLLKVPEYAEMRYDVMASL